MSTPTEKELQAARDRANAAQEAVKRLEERIAYESSFTTDGEVHVISRRNIDNGRFERIEGVFLNVKEATRYASGLGGYGIGHDLFIDSYPLYR